MNSEELQRALGDIGRETDPTGAFVDILGSFENLARTPIRTIAGPYGNVRIAPVEELIVERILVSKYPQDYPPALDCARKLVAAALQGEVEADWREVNRLAATNAYANWRHVEELICEQAKALQVRSPYDSDRHPD